MENQISYVAVGLFLEKSVEEKIIKLSQKLYDEYDSWWRLSDVFPPHISLWLAYLPTKNEVAVIEEIKEIVKNIGSINVELADVDIKDNNKEYYVNQGIIKTEQLTNLHYVMLERLNQYREEYICPKYLTEESQNSMSDLMKENVKKYGTRFVAQLYDPHISISFIDKGKVDKKAIEECIPAISGTYSCNELIVFKQKESGKSIDVLSKITF
ncbi:MAG: hypothetical protein K2L07_12610 [Lachnospiraceae bacterium]|nr:hypothetical protein [Lachnospiraceae bacterium]